MMVGLGVVAFFGWIWYTALSKGGAAVWVGCNMKCWLGVNSGGKNV